MINKKELIYILIIPALCFILLFVDFKLFVSYPIIKKTVALVLALVLALGILLAFRLAKSKLITFLISTCWIFVCLQTFNFVNYILGNLPRYGEHFYISLFISFVFVSICVGIIGVIARFLFNKKEVESKVDPGQSLTYPHKKSL